MNKKSVFVLLCVILIVIILSAVFVYDKLYQDYAGSGGIALTQNDGSVNEVENAGDTSDEQANFVENEQTQQSKASENDSSNLAPDVEIFDGDGNSVMLSQFFDKPTVLNFWATWCGPCKSEMPGFENLYNKYSDRVNFVMLNVSDTKETVADFLKENGYSFPIYYDQTQIASYTYGASSIPLTFVINKGGEVYGYQIGVLPEEALEGAIKTVLGEE